MRTFGFFLDLLLVLVLSCSLLNFDLKSENLSKQDQIQLDSLYMQKKLEDARSSITISEWNFERRVLTLEKITLLECMPAVHLSLAYIPQDASKSCLAAIEELLTLHPQNAIGICAKLGLDSKECSAAYENLYLIDFDYLPSETREQNLRLSRDFFIEKIQLDQNQPNKISSNDIKNAINEFRHSSNPNERFTKFMEVRMKLYSYLPFRCETTNNRILKEVPENAYKASQPVVIKTEDGDPDELSRLIKDFLSENDKLAEIENKASVPDEQDADKSKYFRIRTLDSDCITAISDAYSFQKGFPLAICYREGFSSPNCVKAVIEEKKYILKWQQHISANKKNPKQTEPVKSGLESF